MVASLLFFLSLLLYGLLRKFRSKKIFIAVMEILKTSDTLEEAQEKIIDLAKTYNVLPK